MDRYFTLRQEKAIQEKMTLLKGIIDGSYTREELEERITQKRLAWFKQNESELKKIQEFGSLGLFVLMPYLYTGYMKVNLNDYERYAFDDEDHGKIFLEIASRNFCPYLEACKRLDLDTHDICSNVLERPVRELVSLVSPRSSFYRGEIRPYQDYCHERVLINTTGDEYMKFWRVTHTDEYQSMLEMCEPGFEIKLSKNEEKFLKGILGRK